MDLPFSPQVTAGWIVAAFTTFAAVFERLKSSKKEKKTEQENALLADAKFYQDRAEMFRKAAEDNLALYKQEHEEHQKTRDYWHGKAGEFQVTLLSCQEKLSEMTQRPDYSDILVFIKEQTETTGQILIGIKDILNALKTYLPK